MMKIKMIAGKKFYQHCRKFYFFNLMVLVAFTQSFGQPSDSSQWSQEYVTFADGSLQEHYIFYNTFNEILSYEDQQGDVRHLSPDEVVSFEYKGSRYYSLPFSNGKLSFFKVEYEGNQTALLSKANSVNLMQYLAATHSSKYTICAAGRRNDQVKLCEIYNDFHLNAITGSKTEPVFIKDCIFVITEDGLKLYQLSTMKNRLWGLFDSNGIDKFVALKNLLEAERYQEVRKFSKTHRLDEHKLDDLISIFEFYDQLDDKITDAK